MRKSNRNKSSKKNVKKIKRTRKQMGGFNNSHTGQAKATLNRILLQPGKYLSDGPYINTGTDILKGHNNVIKNLFDMGHGERVYNMIKVDREKGFLGEDIPQCNITIP